MTRPALLATTALASSLAIFIAMPSALAQQSSAEGATENVVVSASRLNRVDVPTPLMVVGPLTLQEGSHDSAIAALDDLPQFKSTSPTVNGSTFMGTGAFPVDLRGLGAARTLVLLNGRRLVNDLQFPDWSIVPNTLLKAVDVVTGSASAAWGSDAVSGVVNFRVDDEFQGFRVGAQGGESDRGDAARTSINVTAGDTFAGGRGHLVFAGEYANDEPAGVRSTRPNVGRWSVVNNSNFTATNGQQPLVLAPNVGFANASTGGLILSGVNSGKTFNPDGSLRAFNFGTVQATTSIGGEGPAFDDVVPLYFPSTRYNFFGRASYDVTPDIKVTADLIYSQQSGSLAEFVDADRGDLNISVDNAFLPTTVKNQMIAAGQTSFTMGRFNSDFQVVNSFQRNLTQFTLAAEGKIGGSWHWDAYYSHGLFQHNTQSANERIKANFTAATDSVISPTTGQPICRSALTTPSTNCVPINLFGFGSPSKQALNYVLGTSVTNARTTLDTGALTLRGEPFELWAGPVSVAVGIEGRGQSLTQTVGPLDQLSALAVFNNTAFTGSNTTKEAFGELQVPIIKDVFLLNDLEFNGAARFTDDRTGSIWSWKFGATDEVAEGLRVRASHSRDIRAPTLIDLFGPRFGPANQQISDPVTNTSYTTQVFTGGNPNLKPEASITTTAGVTYAPPQIDNLVLTADYFDINIGNAISTISSINTVNACQRGVAVACQAITRGSNGLITSINASTLNFVSLKTSGVDVSALYTIPWDLPGTVRIRANLTWNTTFSSNDGQTSLNFMGSEGKGNGTFGAPYVLANTAIYYDLGDFQGNLRTRFISAGYYDRTQKIQNNHYPAFWYFDLGAKYTVVKDDGLNVELYGGINNLFDRDPPPGTQSTAYYDVIGRYYTGGIRVNL